MGILNKSAGVGSVGAGSVQRGLGEVRGAGQVEQPAQQPPEARGQQDGLSLIDSDVWISTRQDCGFPFQDLWNFGVHDSCISWRQDSCPTW